MSTVYIYVDIDGTLRDNQVVDRVKANERVRSGLIWLKKGFKNTKIVVWSGGGELYARQVCAAMGIDEYVDSYAAKQRVACQNPLSGCDAPEQHHHHFVLPEGVREPDIAIDDIQSFSLGKVNLIVMEK